MSNEVELKFLVTDDVFTYLEKTLSQFKVSSYQDKTLKNSYFDTPEQTLRSFDFGLRIRTAKDLQEQTIKLAGQDIGGLFQRPEYTVPVSNDWPDIYLYPNDIWPKNTDIGALQNSLKKLFTTDFHRRTWQVEVTPGSLIEVAYDIGFIEANSLNEAINEVELEIISGDVDALFQLAEVLSAGQNGWLLGCASKAQRGYRLAGLAPEPDVRRMGYVPISSTQTTYTALLAVLKYAIRHWQFHEQLYLKQPSVGALLQLRSAAGLVLHSRQLFADVYSALTATLWQDDLAAVIQQFNWLDDALVLQRMQFEYKQMLKNAPCQSELNAEVIRSHEALPSISQTRAFLMSPEYSQVLLKLTKWLATHSQIEADLPALTQSVMTLARQKLDQSWQELLSLSHLGDELDHEQYQSLRELLRHNLQVGVCFAALFDNERMQGFRLPWLNMLGRLSDLEHIEWIFDAATRMECPHQAELNQWLHVQLKPRLIELDQIRLRGVGMQPYWE